MNPNSTHHVWREPGTAHHLQSTILKVKCAGSSPMLCGCFSAAGTDGLIRVEEKLNAPRYCDSLMKTQSRAFRASNWAEGLPSNRTMTLNTQQEWLKGQLCKCPWVAQPQPGLEPNQIFLEKHENVHLPPSNLTELERWRDEEKNGRSFPNADEQSVFLWLSGRALC